MIEEDDEYLNDIGNSSFIRSNYYSHSIVQNNRLLIL